MRYSNAGEIIIMTVAWAALLLVVDKAFNKPTVEQVQTSLTKPQITMLIRHVGCNERYKEVVRALKTLPWLGVPQVVHGQHQVQEQGERHENVNPSLLPTAARPEQTEKLCAVRVLAPVQRVEQTDFMELSKTLRAIGIVPATIEFGGIPRFALKAEVSDLSCDSCARAARDALTPLGVSPSYYLSTSKSSEIDVSKLTTFRWLEKKSVYLPENTVTASVRINNTARVEEMIRSLEGAGLLPVTIRIVVEN